MSRNQLDTEKLARNVRLRALMMVYRARASHIGSALSICDILAVLYGKVLRFDPRNPAHPLRDRFILSKGHACTALYGTLAEVGFFPISDLDTYGNDHSVFMNHVSHKVPGVEFSTGSLGHGLPFGVGKAVAARLGGDTWRTFVLMSDGELGEGSNWEAFMFAAHHKLETLVAVIDYNKLQSLDTVENTLGIEPLAAKAEAFGWATRSVDGHDHIAIEDALTHLPWIKGKPSLLITHTTKGKGVSFMENSLEWHYKSPSHEQVEQALLELDCA